MPSWRFTQFKQRVGMIFMLGLLGSCASVDDGELASEESETRARINILRPASVESTRQKVEEEMALPDLLYAGLQALDADRLLTPVENNAYDYFARALALDSNNEIARDGLDAIVVRYLTLAREAIRNGSFESADLMIERARRVNSRTPGIAVVVAELAKERESDDLFFQLNGSEVVAQSEAARAQLADIARQARDCEAFFLITAPTDAIGRWMFLAMRESVDGYRLRGNIELSSQTGVRLRLPDTAESCSV